MHLNPLLVRSYKIEYETTQITKEQLRMKYQIPESLDMTGWAKPQGPQQEQEILPPATTPQNPAPPPADIDQPNLAIDTMLEDILEIKQTAVNHVKTWMATEAEFAEVKEFKDMLAVVDGIEKSIRPQVQEKPVGVTVQVLVQNLMQEFQRDC